MLRRRRWVRRGSHWSIPVVCGPENRRTQASHRSRPSDNQLPNWSRFITLDKVPLTDKIEKTDISHHSDSTHVNGVRRDPHLLRAASALKKMQGSHATFHKVSVARRVHRHCLLPDNVCDGTKQRCYEEILRKHQAALTGDEYRAARTREHLTKLQRKLQQPSILRIARTLLRSALRAKSPLDPRAEAFLKEIKKGRMP